MNQSTSNLIKSLPMVGDFLYKVYWKLNKEKEKYYNKRRIKKAQKYSLIYPSSLPLFEPGSASFPPLQAKLTILSANKTIPLIELLFREINHLDESRVYSVEDFCATLGNSEKGALSKKLERKFLEYKSDKSSTHNYHLVYGSIFEKMDNIAGLLEIGLGSNDPEIASNMGINGSPGASLRAFRDVLPNTMIYGADYDKKILFEEDRIKTFFVDQTDLETLESLDNSIKGKLDIIIDDGLHAPNANLATFLFALKRMNNNKSGAIIIEDILEAAIPLWKLVSNFVKDKLYQPYIIKTKLSYMFVCIKRKITKGKTSYSARALSLGVTKHKKS